MNAIALLLAVVAGQPTVPPAASLPPDYGELVGRMEQAFAATRDLTCTFHRREYKGEQLPPDTVALKVRTAPHSVYMKWPSGQEALWRQGWNGGKLRAHPGSFPDFTVNLGITSAVAMRGSRHPITMAGISSIVPLLGRDYRTLSATPGCVNAYRDLGTETVFGETSRCFEVEMDKRRCPELYAVKARFCVHPKLHLPIKLHVWDYEDGSLRLVEDYGFEDLKTNVGLTDSDFDPDNPAYDF